jgi:hypothetical protein
MNGIPRLKVPGLAALLLALGTWGAAPNAMADCSCMCVEGVAYEVCIGIVTTQTQTQECTEQLQCPTAPGSEPGDPVEPPPENADLDCRLREVYRPDLGEYKLHTVCMPAARTEAHDQLRAKREEMAAKVAEQSGGSGKGPH